MVAVLARVVPAMRFITFIAILAARTAPVSSMEYSCMAQQISEVLGELLDIANWISKFIQFFKEASVASASCLANASLFRTEAYGA